MYKVVALGILILLSVTPGSAQGQKEPTCRLYFAVVPKFSPDAWGVWWPAAKKWWLEEGKDKFPELCEGSRQQSSFVLIWKSELTKGLYGEMKKEDTQIDRSPQAEYVCDNGQNGNENCTVVPRINAPQLQGPAYTEQADRLTVVVSRIQAEKSVPVKTFVRIGGNPAKASFQDAMNVLRKESKKASAAK